MEFYLNPDTLSQQLKEGIVNLLNEVGQNKELVKKVLDDFIQKTPYHLAELRLLVDKDDTIGLKDKLHLLKVRYGYLGLKSIMNEIDGWENSLSPLGLDERSQKFLALFENLNSDIISNLILLNIDSLDEGIDTKPLSVLIVDDDEINTLIIKQMLEQIGHSVHLSSNGYQATQLVTQKSFDVIFVDIHMPFFSGIEAIKRIRSTDPTIFIIAISASKDSVDVNACLAEGANEFLPKPIKAELLNEVLIRSTTFEF